jgi:4a-hydroxytetrahydrobiopterin dehydratase
MNSEWKEMDNNLYKTFKFKDFVTAMQWMQAASIEIEALGHHPEWTNIYNKVMVKLTTHDAGNTVTDKDRQLAVILDGISVN